MTSVAAIERFRHGTLRPLVTFRICCWIYWISFVQGISAWAMEPMRARLHYQREVGAEQCPEEVTIRNGVAARLGYDPFSDEPSKTVSTSIARRGGGLSAIVVLTDESGQTIGSRTLSSATADCSELAAAIAFAITVALDPSAVLRLAPATPSEPPPLPPARSPEPPKTKLPLPPSVATAQARTRIERLGFQGGVGSFGAIGALPTAMVGVMAEIGLRYKRASLHLAGRFDFPSQVIQPSSMGAEAFLITGLVLPCYQRKVPREGNRFELSACGLGGVAVLHGSGLGVANPRQQSGAYGALGGRLAAAVRLGGPLWVRLHMGLLAPLGTTSLRVDHVDVWTTPVISGDVGLSLVVFGDGISVKRE